MIPVIDISSAVAGIPSDDLVAAVREAITGVGFFQVTGHGVAPAVIDAAYDGAAAFLALDDDVKALSADAHPFRGWSRPDARADARVQQRFQFCVIESPEHAAERCVAAAYADYFRPNRWPDSIDLRPALLRYTHEVQRAANVVMSLFARVLDLAPAFFEAHHTDPVTCMAVNHYEGASRDEHRLTALGAHQDSGTLTVLHQRGDYEGLRVEMRDGTHVMVPMHEDTFVINIGELMARWTNDVFTATRHDVVLPSEPGQRRTSLTLFHLPNVDVEIAPLPSTIGAEGPHYEPVTPYTWERQFLDRFYGPALR